MSFLIGQRDHEVLSLRSLQKKFDNDQTTHTYAWGRVNHIYKREAKILQPCKQHFSLQPSNSRVTINSDGRTVDLKINLGVDYTDLSNETFTYTVSVMPGPSGQPLNSSTTSYVVFTESTASGCQAGRKIGSTPSITDERYEEGDILFSNDGVHLRNYATRIPDGEVCVIHELFSFLSLKHPLLNDNLQFVN